MIRVLIADDHEMFIDGLSSVLDGQDWIQVEGKVNSGEEAVRHLQSSQCDVVLLDISMPGQGGLETASQILEGYPNTKVLMLTMIDNRAMIEKLVGIGVHGYLLKTASSEELLDAIRTIYNNEEYYSKEVTSKIVQGLRIEKSSTFALTAREKEILELIAKGLRTSEIADRLFISTHTVDTHRKNLLSKAGVKNSIDLINWGRENEYLM